MTEYHSSESTLSNFEDKDECDHSDHTDFDKPVGDRLTGTNIDAEYVTVFFCEGCNHFVQEVYNYEGIDIV